MKVNKLRLVLVALALSVPISMFAGIWMPFRTKSIWENLEILIVPISIMLYALEALIFSGERNKTILFAGIVAFLSIFSFTYASYSSFFARSVNPVLSGSTGSANKPSDQSGPDLDRFLLWPLPRPSAKAVIPRDLVVGPDKKALTLGDVASVINKALKSKGYVDMSYYKVPEGFAVLTHLEQINEDGTIMKDAKRWVTDGHYEPGWSLWGYLTALFTAPSGYYRVIAFVVTSVPVTVSENKTTEDRINNLLIDGMSALPGPIGSKEFSDEYSCTALIYEFEHQQDRRPDGPITPGRLPAEVHLQQARLFLDASAVKLQ